MALSKNKNIAFKGDKMRDKPHTKGEMIIGISIFIIAVTIIVLAVTGIITLP